MHRPLVLAFMLSGLCMVAGSQNSFGEETALLEAWAKTSGIAVKFTSMRPATSYMSTRRYPPTVSNPIPNQERSITAGPFEIDLNHVFSGGRGKLRFTIEVNNLLVAAVEVQDSQLLVTPQMVGETRIRITAWDEKNDHVSDTFTLTVRSNDPPRLSKQKALPDQVMILGEAPYSLDLPAEFEDPDDDPLVFSAASSNPYVAAPKIEDEVLIISPTATGEAVITVTVDDTQGESIKESFRIEVVRPYPGYLETNLTVPFDDPDDQASYRMIALPGERTTSIASVASGQYERDWVAYAADTVSSGVLIPYDRSTQFLLKPGKGLWFLQKKPWVISGQIIPSVPLSPEGAYSIALHPGWNIISNPFDADIPWHEVTDRNGLSQGIWRWEGAYTMVDTLYSAMHRGEAFYFNNVEQLTSIELPYPDLARRSIAKKGRPEAGLSIEIVAEMNEDQRAAVGFGLRTDAAPGLDRFDQFAPPPHFSKLGFVIDGRHPDFDAAPLALETRPPDQDAYAVPLTLFAPEGAIIRFRTSGVAPGFYERAVLVNLRDTHLYDLGDWGTPSLVVEAQETPFQLVIGDSMAVRRQIESLKPQGAYLKQNYPNPFSTTTTIEYTVPEPHTVSLKIFDLLGRHVATLVDGNREAGLYRVAWDGADRAGIRVASGLYVYRLRVGRSVQSMKLIVR